VPVGCSPSPELKWRRMHDAQIGKIARDHSMIPRSLSHCSPSGSDLISSNHLVDHLVAAVFLPEQSGMTRRARSNGSPSAFHKPPN
jgi:hypothetical protein